MSKNHSLFAESWNIAWRRACPGAILCDSDTVFQVVKNPIRYWAADPFIVEWEGITYVFAELYDYILRRGIIGYCTITNNMTSKWKPVIKEKYHLSFPYIYRIGNQFYMIPESHEAGALYRYKATSFPEQWEKDLVIRTGVNYVDTVLLSEPSPSYAISYNLTNNGNHLTLLDLLDSEHDQSLDLPCQFLRRPAGRPLFSQCIRVAQDCSDEYGKGLIFYQYLLSDGQYKEKELTRKYPHSFNYSIPVYLEGIHTYNCCEHFEVIDIKTRRFNPIDFFMRCVHKIKKHLA